MISMIAQTLDAEEMQQTLRPDRRVSHPRGPAGQGCVATRRSNRAGLRFTREPRAGALHHSISASAEGRAFERPICTSVGSTGLAAPHHDGMTADAARAYFRRCPKGFGGSIGSRSSAIGKLFGLPAVLSGWGCSPMLMFRRGRPLSFATSLPLLTNLAFLLDLSLFFGLAF